MNQLLTTLCIKLVRVRLTAIVEPLLVRTTIVSTTPVAKSGFHGKARADPQQQRKPKHLP